MERASTQADYKTRVENVMAFLDAHLADDVTPAALADVAHISLYHFHRIFRGVSGESLMQHTRRRRLEAAALRLRRSEAGVTEVAFEVGFKSHEGFTRAFKEHFGEAPSTWRKQASARLERLAAHVPLTLPKVEIRTTAPRAFVCARHHGSFDEVPAAWGGFVAEASRQGLFTGTEQLVGRYPDDPEITPPGKVRFDVGLVETAGAVAPQPPLRRETLPGGRWAVALHRGSYTTLSDTYLKLVGGYIATKGLELADRPCLEFYLNGPSNTEESALLTEVWAPLYA